VRVLDAVRDVACVDVERQVRLRSAAADGKSNAEQEGGMQMRVFVTRPHCDRHFFYSVAEPH